MRQPRPSDHVATRPIAIGALVATLVLGISQTGSGQPVTERSPNVEGTWVTAHRTLHFTFSHRFGVVGSDVDVGDIFGDAKIVNYPTFALTYGLLDGADLGFRYSSNSALAGGPNEWQPYAKWSPIRSSGRGPSLATTIAWNGAAGSVDGEVNVQAGLGLVTVLGAIRGFSDAFVPGEDDTSGAIALAAGALFRLTRHLSLAADVADRVAGADADVAWSGGLQIGIPHTPHTLSLLATNVTSGTLQGVSSGSSETVYWGFEFTVPFSGFARWGEILKPRDASEVTRSMVDARGRAVVEVQISDFSYGGEEMRVPAGTTVRWVNRDPVGHTVTPDAGSWGSSLIGPGETFEHTFSIPGEHSYHCLPHPYMKSRIVVTGESPSIHDVPIQGG